jgi:hypothetical protein
VRTDVAVGLLGVITADWTEYQKEFSGRTMLELRTVSEGSMESESRSGSEWNLFESSSLPTRKVVELGDVLLTKAVIPLSIHRSYVWKILTITHTSFTNSVLW